MEDFKIEVEETNTYWERMRRVFFWPFLILTSYCLFLYLFIGSMILPTLIVYIPFITLMISQSDFCCASYIHFIEITENRVHIIGTKRDRKFEINDSIENFIFKFIGHRGIIASFNSIKITYQGNVIAQSNKWNWKKENAFNQLLDYLEKYKLLRFYF